VSYIFSFHADLESSSLVDYFHERSFCIEGVWASNSNNVESDGE
jgi:hypothetical protein